jgi:hypothetical protein
MDTKKFQLDDDTDGTETKQADVLKIGDWVLTWNPKGKDGGFEFYTPMGFPHTEGTAPLGGVLMAAFYFLVNNDSEDFMQSVIARANAVARETEAYENQNTTTSGSSKPTLN